MTRLPERGQPSRVDIVVAAGLAVGSLIELHSSWAFERVTADGPNAVHYAAVVIANVAVAWRRLYPEIVTPLVVAAFTTQAAVTSLPNTYGEVLTSIVAVYSLTAHGRGRGVAVAAGVTLALSYVLGLADAEDPIGVAVTNVIAGMVVMALGLLARRARTRADRMTAERDHAHARLEGIAREERDRIARELHDIVAHGMSVVVLQARGGRRWLVADPRRAAAALDDIERVAGACLEETRRLVGILRADSDEDAPLAPQPTIADLPGLVEVARSSGAVIGLTISGDRRELPPALELAAFRIAQEAMTNWMKHAPGSAARVELAYEESGIRISVTDDGPGSAPSDGGGHGLVGMRERVDLYGGELAAGPAPGGGFAVSARLPYDGARR